MTVPKRRPARPHSCSRSRSARRQCAARKPTTVTRANNSTKTTMATQFIAVSSLGPVIKKDDQGRGNEEPEELIPIEERKPAEGRFDRVVEGHPQEGDERQHEQPAPPAGQALARVTFRAAVHGRAAPASKVNGAASRASLPTVVTVICSASALLRRPDMPSR